MKIKLSDYIADFFVKNGIEHCFTVTGGGAMHLNDAFGHKEGMHCIYNHHEQASAIAAEGYARLSGKPALCCVTSGPGGTNAITGVMGAWVDSIPMIVVSGQVKKETTLWSTNLPLRQLGDQEFNIIDSVKNMTKYAQMVTDPLEIRYHLEKAVFLAKDGRPGPVWLDIPLDVQAAVIDTKELSGFHETKKYPVYEDSLTEKILEKIKQAKRPVLLAGTAIRLADAYEEFLSCIDQLNIPVVTAWNAHDLLWEDHPLFCGKPGTVGTRGGNFIVQNCDLLFILGCRMNIRMISYNQHQFAKDAYKIMVDIDENELWKPTLKIDFPIHANVKDVLSSINKWNYKEESDRNPEADRMKKQQKINENHKKWLAWCRQINQRYPVVNEKHYQTAKPMNPYAFFREFFQCLEEGEKIICGNGSACVMTFQACEIKKGQRLFTNSGCAAMGYGFPAAIGAAVYEAGKRVVCVDGDGSFQMNLQELQTVVYHKLNLKIFYINNQGYHSIRQTQTNLFDSPLVGVCDGNGISFPEIKKIAYAYGIPYRKIENIEDAQEVVRKVLSMEGPVICEVIVDPNQNFEPKLSSRVLSDGRIVSSQIDDMFPFLDREEYEKIKKSAEEL